MNVEKCVLKAAIMYIVATDSASECIDAFLLIDTFYVCEKVISINLEYIHTNVSWKIYQFKLNEEF